MNQLRVSVATYDQVVFPHPENGITMLALERKATVLGDGSVHVHTQPFGGGVKILDSKPLEELIGEIRFDSERSEQEQDFRILIGPSQWEAVKQYCFQHLANADGDELESVPDRELVEEFEETLGVDLKRSQYTVEPTGFVLEDQPVFTENWHARGYPTVRVYRTYKVQLVDAALCNALLNTSREIADDKLARRALRNARGRANSVLALPLRMVRDAYLAFPPAMRYRKINVGNQELDESVLVVLGDVDVPQYRRISLVE
jgi:hypothetical protein